MHDPEELYLSIGTSILGSERSQLFGKPCFKINEKAFIAYFQEQMVFKLTGDMHAEALSLDGSILFDPSGKNRPMKEWVQVPFEYKDTWTRFTKAAADYVGKAQ